MPKFMANIANYVAYVRNVELFVKQNHEHVGVWLQANNYTRNVWQTETFLLSEIMPLINQLEL